MENNKDLYNVSLFSDSYFRYFEVGLGYFITDGGSRDYSNSFDFKKYHSFLGTAHFPTLSRNASRNAYLQGTMCFLNVYMKLIYKSHFSVGCSNTRFK